MPDSPRALIPSIDVAVIGGGPAGSAAARLLAVWGHDVALVDRAGTASTEARRSLAESLPPSCAKLFDRIGISATIDAAGFIRSTGNTVQWDAGGERVEPFGGGERGLQIERHVFDDLLRRGAAEAGAAQLSNHSLRDATRLAGGEWLLELESPGGPRQLRAHWLLDCTGRSGIMARRGLRRTVTTERTTAVVGVWEQETPWPVPDPTHTLVESYADGWAWSIPVSSARRFVTVMLDPAVTPLNARGELAASYRAELARTNLTARTIAGARLVDAPWGADATPYSASRADDDHLLLVGDAASFVDPLSSFGVKKALASAWRAAVVVHTALIDSAMTSDACALHDAREQTTFDVLQRRAAELSRHAASRHASEFWASRSEQDESSDAGIDDDATTLDVGALREDPRVLAAFDEIRRRPSIALRPARSLHVLDRPTIRGNRVVREPHLANHRVPRGVRYCRNIDLVTIADLAPRYDQVPSLFDAYNRYNRASAPAPLPDFLGALSTLVGLEMLTFA